MIASTPVLHLGYFLRSRSLWKECIGCFCGMTLNSLITFTARVFPGNHSENFNFAFKLLICKRGQFYRFFFYQRNSFWNFSWNWKYSRFIWSRVPQRKDWYCCYCFQLMDDRDNKLLKDRPSSPTQYKSFQVTNDFKFFTLFCQSLLG